MISKRKRFLFLFAAACIPVVVLILLEIALSVAGVGEKVNTPFIELEDGSGHVAFSPRYAARYFNGFVPSVAFNPFLRTKQQQTTRIVVLGGSSTAGFPYQFYYGFPETMGRVLSATSPDRDIEVINLGMTAVSSYTLWDLRSHLLELDPDVVVIYAGHNEYYGAYGAASTINAFGKGPFFKRIILRLKKTALYSGLELLITRPPADPNASPSGDPDRTLMARVVGESDIPLDGKVYQAGITQFESNMSAVLNTFRKHNIPVFIGTLVSNLSGQRPLGSNSEATELFEGALKQECTGRGCGLDQFQEALDLDNIRFRAPSAINDVIIGFSQSPNVHLVELRTYFSEKSETGVPGNDLFIDHLHPTDLGYELIGRRFAEEIGNFLNLAAPPSGWPLNSQMDPLEKSHSLLQIERLLADYPFFKDRSPQEIAEISDQLVATFRSGSIMDSLAATLVAPPRPISQGLVDAIGLSKSEVLSSTELELYEALFHWQPFNIDLMKSVVSQSIKIESLDPNTTRLAFYGARKSNDIYFWNSLGALFIRNGHLDAAGQSLSQAERLNAESQPMLFNKARYLLAVGDTLTAQLYFQKFQTATSALSN